MDTTLENITATATTIPIDEKMTTIGAVTKGEDIPSSLLGQEEEEEEEVAVATATAGTAINSSSSSTTTTTVTMETTVVDNATTTAISPAVKKDDMMAMSISLWSIRLVQRQ